MKNILKRFILFTLAAYMFSVNAYAKDFTYEVTVDSENISAAEDSLTSEKDYSELFVNVIKSVNGQASTVYSGKLGDYANGAYSKIDFSKIEFLLVCNWKSMNEEAVYIIPSTTQASIDSALSMTVTKNTEDPFELQNSFAAKTVQTNVSLMYNNKYCENVLMPGQTLNIPVTIKNTGTENLEIIPYVAKYDLSGNLTDLVRYEEIIVPVNQKETRTLTKVFDDNTACTAKIFLWKKNSMTPVADSVQLKIENQDYYADTFTQANEISISKQICGVINTDNDIDIVKFTPNITGIYALQVDASSGTICGVYDDSQNLLNSVSAVEGKKYLLYSLTANKDYYIRLNGTADNSYNITPALPGDIEMLTKNVGTEKALSDSNGFNVYKFTPEASGSYIITAVDNLNVNAELYDSSFEKIAAADTADSDVSFRITHDMTANSTYYIIVYPKSEAAVGSYTMYIEEPFNIINVR